MATEQVSFSEWFISHGGTRMSITRMWDPIAYALGFIDCDNISARCMLTIFAFFATKTEASVLRMLNGSPDMRLNGPIAEYIKSKGGRYDIILKLRLLCNRSLFLKYVSMHCCMHCFESYWIPVLARSQRVLSDIYSSRTKIFMVLK